MDFAKRQLEKYGWKEGKGLGRNEDGVSTALKPKLKFDNTGIGHEIGKDFTNKWWENLYDKAVKNIEVIEDEKKITVKRVDDADEVEITTKDYSIRECTKKSSSMEYGTFLKTAKLTQSGLINYPNVSTPEKSAPFTEKQLSDEELFAICGGRTAHKGARHGLKLSGKLSRIEKQEKILLKKMQNVQITEDTRKKKLKKIRTLSETVAADKAQASTSAGIASTKEGRKKKKKRKKAVCFNETVLEYTVQEANEMDSAGCSSSSSIEKVEVHQRRLSTKNDDDSTSLDEGIEKDANVKTPDCKQESFSKIRPIKKADKEAKKKKSKKISMPMAEEAQREGIKVERKKKKKRECKDTLDIDIDGVRKIKRKKYPHKEIDRISASLDDLTISE